MVNKHECSFHQNGKKKITKKVVSLFPSLCGERLIIELEDQDCIEISLGVMDGLVQTLPLLGEVRERMRLIRIGAI